MTNSDMIAGLFLEDEIIPKDKFYLKKYFKTGVQRAFLRYSFVCMSWGNFIAHTGCFCTKRYFLKLIKKYKKITQLHETSKKALSVEGMSNIQSLETGKYKVKLYPKKGKNNVDLASE